MSFKDVTMLLVFVSPIALNAMDEPMDIQNTNPYMSIRYTQDLLWGKDADSEIFKKFREGEIKRKRDDLGEDLSERGNHGEREAKSRKLNDSDEKLGRDNLAREVQEKYEDEHFTQYAVQAPVYTSAHCQNNAGIREYPQEYKPQCTQAQLLRQGQCENQLHVWPSDETALHQGIGHGGLNQGSYANPKRYPDYQMAPEFFQPVVQPKLTKEKNLLCPYPNCSAAFWRSSDLTKHKKYHEKFAEQKEKRAAVDMLAAQAAKALQVAQAARAGQAAYDEYVRQVLQDSEHASGNFHR